MNARRSSTRIFSADAANQVANLTWDRRTAWLASPDSRPEEEMRCSARQLLSGLTMTSDERQSAETRDS
jgi:hypothetical protein